jgi:hypothetical protein
MVAALIMPRSATTQTWATPKRSRKRWAGALEVQRRGIAEGDRYLAEQLLPTAIEIPFDEIRGGATLGDLFAESGHRPISVIKRQPFGAGDAKALMPAAGVAIRPRHHQSVQHRQIDRTLDVEVEPSIGKKSIDDLAAGRLPPQPTKHQIRADADAPQFSNDKVRRTPQSFSTTTPNGGKEIQYLRALSRTIRGQTLEVGSERTIDRHGRMITTLLPSLGNDPGIYDADSSGA